MLIWPPTVRVFVYTEPTDMRRSFDRLAAMVEQFLGQDPFSGHLFVFFNKAGDKCKILFWDRTGFVIWYKRLEEGTFEKLSSAAGSTSIQVDVAKLTWLLEGIDLFKARRRKRYQRKDY